MKKTNKHGFTLIEMLVVVAVIAVLVSIIVPVVTNASDKAAAAADAANLRSAKAAIAVGLLDGTYANASQITADDLGIPATSNYKGEDAGDFSVEIANNAVTVKYGDMKISDLADIADNGEDDGSNAASQTIPSEESGS